MVLRGVARQLQGAGHQDKRKVFLSSRNNKDFNSKYPGVARALGTLPDETVFSTTGSGPRVQAIYLWNDPSNPCQDLEQPHGTARDTL